MNWLLAMAMGSLVGLSLGMFGSGGSVLAVPILVYVLGYETKSAIAMSLAIVGLTALTGAVLQWKRGALCLKAALFFSVIGIVGTLGGTWVALRVSGTLQLILFGLLMVVVALAMLRKKEADLSPGKDECHMRPELAGGLGAVVGFMTGFLGVGGGFMIVPALNTLGNLKLRLAIGTSLFVIAVNSAAGVLGYLGKVPFDWPVVIVFVVVSSLASFLGVALSHRLPVEKLRKGFAVFILVLGVGLVVKNLFKT
ncbi:MAG: sulfite exporter TauE/SafE family protein [Deltaproteobacteria bacterium]|nr:sulfite exporter TauE/SafE family protein [Deltaproteobacteria bacterium]